MERLHSVNHLRIDVNLETTGCLQKSIYSLEGESGKGVRSQGRLASWIASRKLYD